MVKVQKKLKQNLVEIPPELLFAIVMVETRKDIKNTDVKEFLCADDLV